MDKNIPQVQPIENSHRTNDKNAYARDTIESLEAKIYKEIDGKGHKHSSSMDMADMLDDHEPAMDGSDIDMEQVEQILKSNPGTVVGDYSELNLPQLQPKFLQMSEKSKVSDSDMTKDQDVIKGFLQNHLPNEHLMKRLTSDEEYDLMNNSDSKMVHVNSSEQQSLIHQ